MLYVVLILSLIPECTCFARTNRLVRARIADSSAPRFRISHHETNLGSGMTSETPKTAERPIWNFPVKERRLTEYLGDSSQCQGTRSA